MFFKVRSCIDFLECGSNGTSLPPEDRFALSAAGLEGTIPMLYSDRYASSIAQEILAAFERARSGHVFHLGNPEGRHYSAVSCQLASRLLAPTGILDYVS